MPEGNLEDARILKRNDIKTFVLRIDLLPNLAIDFDALINNLSTFFERIEKREIEGVLLDLSSGQPEMKKTKDFEYVLVSDTRNISMTFSKPQSAFWLQSSAYQDNSTYKEIFDGVMVAFREKYPDIVSKRIGMRFINEFKCSGVKEIKKIFKTKKANIVISLLEEKALSRAIAYLEYNCDGRKTRLQYGIFNKFYPSVINSYDLGLDIDAYFDIQISVTEWAGKISELNHAAYDFFIDTMNEEYLERLK